MVCQNHLADVHDFFEASSLFARGSKAKSIRTDDHTGMQDAMGPNFGMWIKNYVGVKDGSFANLDMGANADTWRDMHAGVNVGTRVYRVHSPRGVGTILVQDLRPRMVGGFDSEQAAFIAFWSLLIHPDKYRRSMALIQMLGIGALG